MLLKSKSNCFKKLPQKKNNEEKNTKKKLNVGLAQKKNKLKRSCNSKSISMASKRAAAGKKVEANSFS